MTSPSRVTASHSPASPRLPSPPPFPEVQIGPRSPSPSSSNSSLILTPDQNASEDYGAARRIRPGTKAADMALGPPLVPLAELDSAFQLQEHLKSLYLAATTSPSSPNHTQPITRATATSLSTPPPGIDRSLWLYELCRFLVQRANRLIVDFFADNPPCSAANCPEMRASEWQYLCAVHDPPKSCCAIDYCCHTLDWAAGVLTSQRHFPSRLTLGPTSKEGSASQTGDAASVRQLTNIFRRVYRMFAHAWFQHRDVFWAIENQEGLYMFYKTVCDVYNLIPEDNYTVPPEAEGLREQEKPTEDMEWTREPLHGTNVTTSETTRSSRPSSLDFSRTTPSIVTEDYCTSNDQDVQSTVSTGATTRRHKHTPSTGNLVTTIHESEEDSPSTTTSFHDDSSSLGAAEQQTTSQPPKTARLIEGDSVIKDEQTASTSKEESNGVPPEHQDVDDFASAPLSKSPETIESTIESDNHISTSIKEIDESSEDIQIPTDKTPDKSTASDVEDGTKGTAPKGIDPEAEIADGEADTASKPVNATNAEDSKAVDEEEHEPAQQDQ